MLVVDVTETPVERKEKQRQFYSGKKKRHTLKSQVVVNQATGAIVCTAHAKGRVPDFQVFKHSRLPLTKFQDSTACRQGLLRHSQTPSEQSNPQEKTEKGNSGQRGSLLQP